MKSFHIVVLTWLRLRLLLRLRHDDGDRLRGRVRWWLRLFDDCDIPCSGGNGGDGEGIVVVG